MGSRPSVIVERLFWVFVVMAWGFAAYSMLVGLPRTRRLAEDFEMEPGPLAGFLIVQTPWLALSAVACWLFLFWYQRHSGLARIGMILIPLGLGLVVWGAAYLIATRLLAVAGS